MSFTVLNPSRSRQSTATVPPERAVRATACSSAWRSAARLGSSVNESWNAMCVIRVSRSTIPADMRLKLSANRPISSELSTASSVRAPSSSARAARSSIASGRVIPLASRPLPSSTSSRPAKPVSAIPICSGR